MASYDTEGDTELISNRNTSTISSALHRFSAELVPEMFYNVEDT